MWKFEPFVDFLKDLTAYDYVGEIVIIDNNSSERPNDEILNHSKVKILDFGRNIYTNPAWNEGVKVAKFDKLCICNDDIIFDLRLLREAHIHVTEDLGIMGPSIFPWNQNITDGLIRIKDYEHGDGQFGFSLCMFFHKSNWEPVPETMKLYFGDNFLYDNCLLKGFKIKVIKDIWFYTPLGGRTTVNTLPSEETNELGINDAVAYRDFLLSKGVADPYTLSPAIRGILEAQAPHLL